MGVLLQGFYKTASNQAVPSPADGDATVPWWWDRLAAQANSFRQAGFTAIWLPPVLKSASGSGPGADGYGPFDDYDIGSKSEKDSQTDSTHTRFGNREQLQRCAAVLRANGLDVYLDMVEHQRIGDTQPFIFRYLGANGAAGAGRFPKNPLNFVPNVPRDPRLGGPPSSDIPFGRELAPINAKPPHYVFDNLISAADWLTRALDVQGYRIDDVKGISTDFLLPFLNAKSMAQKFAVGEFFDGNRVLVNGWIFNPSGMQGRVSAFDFPLKFVLTSMCNNAGRFNMADLDHVGLAGISPLNAVTFVENHDTDLNAGEKIIFNKILGYAYILTSEGYPCVYYRDYSTDQNCFGLKPSIDNLIWIHENLAAGPTQQRWKDFNVFAYERLGGPRLVVGLNNDPGTARTITVATGFGSNVTLHDYTGHGPNVITDGTGSATITVPANRNGLGYVCYSRDGLGGAFVITTHAVTQDFDGAADLDIPPAANGKSVQVGQVWCAANSPVSAVLKPDVTNWAAATSIKMELMDPEGALLANQTFDRGPPPGTALRATAPTSGFYAIQLQASNLPAETASYSLSVTYTAPQNFVPGPAVSSAALAAPAKDASEIGQWSQVIPLPNVPIHTHVLPSGKVLFWGRREQPGSTVFATLNEHQCFPFIWDPALPNTAKQTGNQPTLADGKTGVNLFCSGHTFLPDGRLLVIGGHLFDSQGSNQTAIYDSTTDRWTATQTMNNGRWYPTAVTLPDGSVLACSGTFATGPLQPPQNSSTINTVQQVWSNGTWNSIVNFIGLPLFPRMHVAPDGRVFMSGGLAESFFLDVHQGGTWTPGPSRSAGNRDYAPSVTYDVGKIIFIGGGSDSDPQDRDQNGPPTNVVEIIDLNSPTPEWRQTSPMNFPRRQHNATILPDGTVLVTGGTQGDGGPTNGFNDVTPGKPVHAAELWNPVSGKWTKMATESVDRCYHSSAVLLPDGRVFSAGGGEYQPVPGKLQPNDPSETHSNVQLFSPPYLFKGPRPDILNAPEVINYGQLFAVGTSQPGQIERASLVRLGSCTHSFDQNQRINFLAATAADKSVRLTAPANANVCPPGHYMLFLLDKNLVPSVAKIVRVGASVAQAAAIQPRTVSVAAVTPSKPIVVPNRRPVVVGVTALCPYGISACWGGAYHALTSLHGVEMVKETPNADDSTADVYLKHDGLPDVDLWPEQFVRIANGTHHFRGVEVTLEGLVRADGGVLILAGDDVRPPVMLAPTQAANKIQWDHMTGARKPLDSSEEIAFEQLAARSQRAAASFKVEVTGPLLKTHAGFALQVRQFREIAP
jgi:hypothetical protein